MTRPLCVFVALLSVLSLPSVASGQSPTSDSVVGTLTFPTPLVGPEQETYEVASGPNGEQAGGEVVVALVDHPGTFLTFEVTCLAVSGNRAVMGMFRPDPIIGDTALYRLIVDGGPGRPDAVGVTAAAGRPTACATIPIEVDPSLQPVTGDAVVTNASALPTVTAQCKRGGWRTYNVFKNQGDCVSYLATKRKNPPSSP